MAEEAIKYDRLSIHNQWDEVCGQLRMEFGATAFESWLKPLSVNSFDDGVMRLSAPTAFMKNWVIAHYSDRIHKIWEHKNPDIKRFKLLYKTCKTPKMIRFYASFRAHLLRASFMLPIHK